MPRQLTVTVEPNRVTPQPKVKDDFYTLKFYFANPALDQVVFQIAWFKK
jgi:hypothetical protein